MINAGLKWLLWINGYSVGNPGTYSHAELGSYSRHGAWGSNPVKGLGYWKCGSRDCHLTRSDQITLGATGTTTDPELEGFYLTITWGNY
jgi:hypothetical protein